MRLSLLTAVILLGTTLSVNASQSAGLTEEGYCNLQGRILSLLELEWQDRLKVAEASPEKTGEEFWKKLEEVGARYRSLRSSLFSEMSTTEDAFAQFSRQSKDSIEQYLSEHSDLSAELDSVKTRINALVEQFEAKMQSR